MLPELIMDDSEKSLSVPRNLNHRRDERLGLIGLGKGKGEQSGGERGLVEGELVTRGENRLLT